MIWHPCLKHIRLCYDPGVLSERMTFYIIKVNYLNKDNIILKLRTNLPNILAPLNNRWWKQLTLYKMFQVHNCYYRISLVCYKGHNTLRQDSYLTNPGWLVLMIVPILFYICFAASALFCKVMINIISNSRGGQFWRKIK